MGLGFGTKLLKEDALTYGTYIIHSNSYGRTTPDTKKQPDYFLFWDQREISPLGSHKEGTV